MRWPVAALAFALCTIGLVVVGVLRLAAPGVEPAVAPAAALPPREIREPAPVLIAGPLPATYVVEEGDTLFIIAAELDSTVEAIVFANSLDDLDLLSIGEELLVPPPGSARQPADPARSLAEIALSYRLEPQLLALYNAIPPDLVGLAVGRDMLLFPPDARPEGLVAGAELADAGLLVSIPFGAERPLEPFVYRVRPGDTLTDVAWRLGIDVDTILNNNSELGDGNRIRIGTELLVLPISGLLYQVQSGDTVSGIADRFNLDIDEIIEFNALTADAAIQVGMDLILPGGGPVYAAPMLAGASRLFVPYRSQLDGTPWAGANCGPVALGMGLESLGIKVSSTELRRQVLGAQGMWGNNVGTLMDALAKVATNHGARPIGLFDGNGIAKWSLKDVREQLSAGRPVVVQVRFRALPGRAGVAYYNDHYIILTGLSGDNFLYNDPLDSDGPGANRVMTPAQLEAAMNATDRRYAYAAFALAK
jgi:LysM repeat protein